MSVDALNVVCPQPLRPSHLLGCRRDSQNSSDTERSEFWHEDTWSNSNVSEAPNAIRRSPPRVPTSASFASLSPGETKMSCSTTSVRHLWPQPSRSDIQRAVSEAQLFRLFGNASHAQRNVLQTIARWSADEVTQILFDSDRLLSTRASLLQRTMMLGYVACLYAHYDFGEAKGICNLAYTFSRTIGADTERALVLMALSAMPKDRRSDFAAIKKIVARTCELNHQLHMSLAMQRKTPSAQNQEILRNARELVKRVGVVARRVAVRHPTASACDNATSQTSITGAAVVPLAAHLVDNSLATSRPRDGVLRTQNLLDDDYVML